MFIHDAMTLRCLVLIIYSNVIHVVINSCCFYLCHAFLMPEVPNCLSYSMVFHAFVSVLFLVRVLVLACLCVLYVSY